MAEIVDLVAVRDHVDDVRGQFVDLGDVISRQGPLATDFVLFAVGRIAEGVLRSSVRACSGHGNEKGRTQAP